MAGPKQLLTEEQYKRWYARHRVVEQSRRWRQRAEANPIKALPPSERGEMPLTYSVIEAFWHPLACECGSCEGVIGEAAKKVRMDMRPIPPAVKSVVSRLPELPDPALPLLQDALEEVRSRLDRQTTQH